MIRKYLRRRAERKQGLPAQFHETRSIFVHVPKTGGVSICAALYDGGEFGHRPYREFLGIDPVAADYLSFAFVRDPVERLLSAFVYVKSGGINDYDREFSRNLDGMDFEAFVYELPRNRKLSRWMHFRPQDFYLDGKVDFIGRFENLTADFATLTDKLGIKANLPHANITREEKPFVTPAARKQIETTFAADYERFGY